MTLAVFNIPQKFGDLEAPKDGCLGVSGGMPAADSPEEAEALLEGRRRALNLHVLYDLSKRKPSHARQRGAGARGF